jgi:hypothetical protein
MPARVHTRQVGDPAEVGERIKIYQRSSLVFFASILVVVIGTVAAFSFAVASCDRALSDAFTITPRPHLEPIPIARSSCPYVALMHAAANQYQSAEPGLAFLVATARHPVPWREQRVQVDQALRNLDAAIRAGLPHFPTPVRKQLTYVLGELRDGRTELAASKPDGSDLIERTAGIMAAGHTNFGNASDLIGAQCPVRLAADANA